MQRPTSADELKPAIARRPAGRSEATGAVWLARWPTFRYDLTVRVSLWFGVLVIAGLFSWGAWQRRWIADDGLIVLRTVRNLLAGNGPVFNAMRDSVLAGTPGKGAAARANAALMQVERALTRPEGLRTRPWYRSLIYVADENNGYSNMVFPSVNEAIRAGDPALAQRELDDLVMRFGRATGFVDAARVALASK